MFKVGSLRLVSCFNNYFCKIFHLLHNGENGLFTCLPHFDLNTNNTYTNNITLVIRSICSATYQIVNLEKETFYALFFKLCLRKTHEKLITASKHE